MKKLFLFVMLAMTVVFCSDAKNRWNVYAGGSINHLCETPWLGSDRTYGWGGGAFAGAGFEINFNSHWSLTPMLQFDFNDNGATLSSPEMGEPYCKGSWQNVWSFNIPILANFRFPVSEFVGLRFGAGAFMQYAMAGRYVNLSTLEHEDMHGIFAERINVGPLGEIAVETGNHLSYMIRAHYPILKEGWVRKILTLSLGIQYSF